MLNKTVNEADVAFLRWLAQDDAHQQQRIRKYRAYYEGIQANQLTERIRGYLDLVGVDGFSLNFLPIVVDAMKERMAIEDIDGPDKVVEWWRQWRRLLKPLMLAMLRDGDAYLMVSVDPVSSEPMASLETAYDGVEGVKLHYASEGGDAIIYATKRWRVEDGPDVYRRMNVYHPDRIEKYRSSVANEAGWETHRDDPDEPWPVPWVDAAGRPLGVPFIHFANNAGDYTFGRSELADMIPAQDAINRAAIDLIAGAETEGFRIVTVTGADVDDLTLRPGMLLGVANPAASIGALAAGDLRGLIDNLDKSIMRLAQMSRTPLSYFQVTGQVASADSQKAGADGLVNKVRDRASVVGDKLVDALRYAAKLDAVFGSGGIAPDADIVVHWAPFEHIDADEVAENRATTAKLKADTFIALAGIGVDRHVAAKVAGYNDEEADAMGTIHHDVLTDIEQ